MRRWWKDHQPISFGPKSRTLLRGGLVAAMLTLTSLASAAPAAAAEDQVVPIQFAVSETTHFVACPVGTPSGSMCAEGQGSGHSTDLGTISESFISIVDFAHPDPRLGTLAVVSRVTLTTAIGDRLILISHGRYNPTTGMDSEVFRVVSGTGEYRGARGGGTAQSVTTGQDGSSILTTTAYNGVFVSLGERGDRADHPQHHSDDGEN